MYISFFKKDLENKGFPVLVQFQIKGLVFWHPTTWRNAQKIWSFFFLIKSIQKNDIQP